jgi:hypothetical protein
MYLLLILKKALIGRLILLLEKTTHLHLALLRTSYRQKYGVV